MMRLLTGVDSAASAIQAEKVRLEVIAQNIANANTTRGIDGKPYQRQTVRFETVMNQQMGMKSSAAEKMVKVAAIQKDNRPPVQIYQPGHPDASADGMVSYPNVSIHEEMADMIVASRAMEASLAIVRNARNMALQTLSIGKH
jgi:flagellar basal-body rod protein FlgC